MLNTTFADTIIRQPDFIDPVEGTAVWIGENGAVEVPLTLIEKMAAMAGNAGWHARTASPSKHGITVAPFMADFAVPAFQVKDTRAQDWALLQEALGARIAWLQE